MATQGKLETYGKRRDWKPKVKIFATFFGLLILVSLLTIGRGIILDEDEIGASVLTGSTSKVEVSRVSGEVVRKMVPIDFDVSSLASDAIIQDLPKKAVIGLELGGQSYIITKGSIVRGNAEEKDLTISVPFEYLGYASGGLCSIVKKASEGGELIVVPEISETSLAWKYRSMLKYKDCLGI